MVKLPAHQSYLLVPVLPKVTLRVETRGRKRSAPPPQTEAPSKFRCEPCNKNFRDNFNLKDHEKKVHDQRDSSLICERYFCKETFPNVKAKRPYGHLLLGVPRGGLHSDRSEVEARGRSS